MSKARDLYEEYINKYFSEPFGTKRVELMSDIVQEQRKEISELEQEKAELIRQNKAFQEQYNTSGEIITKLRQEKAELIEIVKRCYKYEYTYDSVDYVDAEEFTKILQKYGAI